MDGESASLFKLTSSVLPDDPSANEQPDVTPVGTRRHNTQKKAPPPPLLQRHDTSYEGEDICMLIRRVTHTYHLIPGWHWSKKYTNVTRQRSYQTRSLNLSLNQPVELTTNPRTLPSKERVDQTAVKKHARCLHLAVVVRIKDGIYW